MSLYFAHMMRTRIQVLRSKDESHGDDDTADQDRQRKTSKNCGGFVLFGSNKLERNPGLRSDELRWFYVIQAPDSVADSIADRSRRFSCDLSL